MPGSHKLRATVARKSTAARVASRTFAGVLAGIPNVAMGELSSGATENAVLYGKRTTVFMETVS